LVRHGPQFDESFIVTPRSGCAGVRRHRVRVSFSVAVCGSSFCAPWPPRVSMCAGNCCSGSGSSVSAAAAVVVFEHSCSFWHWLFVLSFKLVRERVMKLWCADRVPGVFIAMFVEFAVGNPAIAILIAIMMMVFLCLSTLAITLLAPRSTMCLAMALNCLLRLCSPISNRQETVRRCAGAKSMAMRLWQTGASRDTVPRVIAVRTNLESDAAQSCFRSRRPVHWSTRCAAAAAAQRCVAERAATVTMWAESHNVNAQSVFRGRDDSDDDGERSVDDMHYLGFVRDPNAARMKAAFTKL
jgi:hypothetical protein